jgi:V/A-type H+-transporting ATPase subunit D
MELMRVRRRLATATRGHALLKDKLDGLMQEFLTLLERYKTARRDFEQEFPRILRLFILAELRSAPGAVETALTQSRSEVELTVDRRNVAGVGLLRFAAAIRPGGGYSLLDTSEDFDEAALALRAYFPKLIELAELEHNVWLFIAEIERTRRRVNALKYVMIPTLRNAMRYIRAKLEELERGNIVRLMKIKEIRLAQYRAEMARERASR